MLGLRCWACFSLIVAARAYSVVVCMGFSLQWLLSREHSFMGFSSCGLQALEHSLNSCGAPA